MKLATRAMLKDLDAGTISQTDFIAFVRGEAELKDIMSRIWLQRADRYSELRRPKVAESHALSKVEMYRIGG